MLSFMVEFYCVSRSILEDCDKNSQDRTPKYFNNETSTTYYVYIP